MSDPNRIEGKDIFQANAAIIAGVLIFLSLSASFSNTFGRPFSLEALLFVAFAMIPFILSSIFLLLYSLRGTSKLWLSYTGTTLGLIYLVFAIIYFLITSYIASIQK